MVTESSVVTESSMAVPNGRFVNVYTAEGVSDKLTVFDKLT